MTLITFDALYLLLKNKISILCVQIMIILNIFSQEQLEKYVLTYCLG